MDRFLSRCHPAIYLQEKMTIKLELLRLKFLTRRKRGVTKKNKETRVREAEILDPASVYSREDDGGISTAGTGEEEKENPWALGRRDFFRKPVFRIVHGTRLPRYRARGDSKYSTHLPHHGF